MWVSAGGGGYGINEGCRIPGGVEDLVTRARLYIERCAAERIGAKGRGRFANLAGFCRYLGMGVDAFEREMAGYPEIYGAVCAMFEDEALNCELSATLVSAYLKKRLGYGERADESRSICESAETRLVFEHDVMEDGG